MARRLNTVAVAVSLYALLWVVCWSPPRSAHLVLTVRR